jgi:hypothetical protein
MLSSGMKRYHLELMLSSGMKRYHLELMLSSGTTCYHLGMDAILSSGANVIIWNKMLSSGTNVIMVFRSLCYHLVLSCDVIIWDDNTPPFLFFLKTSLTRIFPISPSQTDPGNI